MTSGDLVHARKSADHLKASWYMLHSKVKKNMVNKNTHGGGGDFDFHPMVYRDSS